MHFSPKERELVGIVVTLQRPVRRRDIVAAAIERGLSSVSGTIELLQRLSKKGAFIKPVYGLYDLSPNVGEAALAVEEGSRSAQRPQPLPPKSFKYLLQSEVDALGEIVVAAAGVDDSRMRVADPLTIIRTRIASREQAEEFLLRLIADGSLTLSHVSEVGEVEVEVYAVSLLHIQRLLDTLPCVPLPEECKTLMDDIARIDSDLEELASRRREIEALLIELHADEEELRAKRKGCQEASDGQLQLAVNEARLLRERVATA